MIHKAFVLAAGFGTRMGDLTKDLPKPLLPVGGRPLIDYTLFYLKFWGIREIVVNVHYHASKLQRHLSSYPHGKISISFESTILGTAGGVRKGMELFSENDSPFLLTNPDTILCPFHDLKTGQTWNPISQFSASADSNFDACLYLFPRPPESRETGFFFQDAADPNNSVSNGCHTIRMSSDGGSHYYMGLSVLSPSSVAHLSPLIPSELGPCWKDSSQAGRLYGKKWIGSVFDAGRRESYESLRNRVPIPDCLMDSWNEFCEGWPILDAKNEIDSTGRSGRMEQSS